MRSAVDSILFMRFPVDFGPKIAGVETVYKPLGVKTGFIADEEDPLLFERIDTMRMARDLGAHAANRQRVIATNVANADTPGYRARDLREFDPDRAPVQLKATRPGHVAAGGWGSAAGIIDARGEPSPNGNSVSIEDEMLRAADAKRQFDLSLSVMQSGLTMMRTALGRRG